MLFIICLTPEKMWTGNKIWVRAVTVSDFDYTIIMSKQIHDEDIIVICIENLKIWKKIMLSVKFIFKCYCVFLSLFLTSKLHSKYVSWGVKSP